MGEVLNVVVAFAVIVFFVRWATSKSQPANGSGQRPREILGFQPKTVTPDMINTIQTMFPDIPRDNIQYDLLKTGNVQMTSNKLIERGYLDAPPQAYFQLYPTQPLAQPPTAPSSASSSSLPAKPTLIARYNLQERLDREPRAESTQVAEEGMLDGKSTWEDTPERREASLRERKAQMVLAARKRFLEQQQQQQEKQA